MIMKNGANAMTINDYLQLDCAGTQSLVSPGEVTIRKKEGRALKAGGAWIYDNEIQTIEGAENGSIVRVLDWDGFFLGYGFLNMNSKLRVRMLARKQENVITPAFIFRRVKDAWNYRKKVLSVPRQNTEDACRVIFGEADFLPGLTIDKYGDVLVIESLALGLEHPLPGMPEGVTLKILCLACLVQLLFRDGIRVRGIYERSDAKVREKEGLERTKGFLSEEFDTNVPITENGIKYMVDVKDGQKTGFFLDQKFNRLAIRGICSGAAEVLDCFTHTGSFGLNAAAAGAAHVTSIDASELAIAQARENAALNGLQDKITYVTGDVFDFLPEQVREGRQYDVVILDPPAFTKSRNSVKAAAHGYREINAEGLRLVKNGGFLATCSCSHFMAPELLRQAIDQAAHDAHKRLRQVEFRQQGPDHPILWENDASYYLKFFIFQVVDEL